MCFARGSLCKFNSWCLKGDRYGCIFGAVGSRSIDNGGGFNRTFSGVNLEGGFGNVVGQSFIELTSLLPSLVISAF